MSSVNGIIIFLIKELAASHSSIIVFLPGITDIVNIRDELVGEAMLHICVLHSLVPKDEQILAIKPAQVGCCKVILSTNIAETSITIPDATVVLDTGLRR